LPQRDEILGRVGDKVALPEEEAHVEGAAVGADGIAGDAIDRTEDPHGHWGQNFRITLKASRERISSTARAASVMGTTWL